ncbi:uncharacterized protein LOC121865514 [Homarus americanus]|uniref:uncharacterized protein LOC121865514 n=1 Tax=Homarus americanus TaxID=6706 RepID=UPI001C43F694|nr:uncharacterized protein LOC121865514 [Homarus americanus]
MADTAPLTLWVLVNKHEATSDIKYKRETEEHNKSNTQLVSVPMWPQWTAREVQVALLKTLGLGHTIPSSTSSIGVRNAHGALLPLTPTTLKSTPVRPLLVEIHTAHHKGTEKEERETTPLLPPSFRKTVQDIIASLETRLSRVEEGLGSLKGRRAALVESELRQIQDTLNFMSRRLDLTRTPAWVTGGQT